jgi:hypothetical protein
MRVKNGDVYRVWCVLYQQYDGYLSVVGKKLIEFLSSVVLVNGIPLGDTRKFANGAGCLFVQIITLFKDKVGGAYLINPNDICDEEWNYYVDVDAEKLSINLGINNGGDILFDRDIKDAKKFLDDYCYDNMIIMNK